MSGNPELVRTAKVQESADRTPFLYLSELRLLKLKKGDYVLVTYQPDQLRLIVEVANASRGKEPKHNS
jgi:hypothetical protein